MTRLILFVRLAVVGVALAAPLAAQLPAPRSRDYLFVTGTDDARALWVNPAGLARPIASLFGEVTGTRTISGGWHVGQYSLALSSRNIAFGYRRDRFENAPDLGTWRVAGGLALTRLTLGTAIELHQSRRSWDIGLQYFPAPPVTFGAVVRNIGRPVVRQSTLRLTAVGSVSWRVARGTLFSVDAVAVERRPASGYDKLYRAGAQVLLPVRRAVGLVTAFEFPEGVSGVRLARWSLGLSLGQVNQLVGVATTLEPDGAARQLEAFSLAAVAKGAMRAAPRFTPR